MPVSATLTPAMNRAVAAFGAGRLAEAEQVCRAILAANRNIAEAHHLLAVVLSSAGRTDEAMASYDCALALRPNYLEALCDRGVTLYRAGRFEAALASYDRALALRPDHAAAHYNRGIALAALKGFDTALESYDRALALRPDYPEALCNRGNALKELGRLDAALASYDRALAQRGDFPDALHNRGLVLHGQKRFAEALASYDRALALRGDFAETHYHRGNALKELGRPEEALASYDRAVALRQDHAEALANRGFILHELYRFEEAVFSYDRALAARPDSADTLFNRGIALFARQRLDEALASFDRALTLRPRHAEALNSRASTLFHLDRFEEAVASYDAALAIRPDYAEAHTYRGAALRELGQFEAARASYDEALALDPSLAVAQFGACLAELPVLYTDEADIESRRTAYERRLRRLCDRRSGADEAELAKGVGPTQPFFLAYQGRNDRELQALLGSFVCRIVAQHYPPAPPAPPPRPGEPVRVGFVSGFFRNHSNWKLPIKGWLGQLDRGRFAIFGYHTGVHRDGETGVAAAMCDRFVEGPLPIERWRAAILEDAPHVLIYPEVSMDPVAAALAAQRLAAVQCNSWGHPDTSGFPTLDYYLSSDLMEPADGQDHYTERLIRLPNLSVHCQPIEPPAMPMARHELGLRASATVYWCGQSLFKYLPQFDEVFARIASGDPDCQFAFIEHIKSPRITELFRQRLDRAFAACGLRADAHCVFLPRLGQKEFVAASGCCDIFLDSIGWSGCNSTLESLPYDLPVVTLPGPLMRGRHGMAILKRMGVTETIAATVDGYVETAVRLARDAGWRSAVKAKIAAGKQRIYYDRECISALEQFLDRVGRRLPAP